MPGDVAEGGWGWPGSAAKPHYFAPGEIISLCGKWMYTGPRQGHGIPTEADCRPCGKKMLIRQTDAALNKEASPE